MALERSQLRGTEVKMRTSRRDAKVFVRFRFEIVRLCFHSVARTSSLFSPSLSYLHPIRRRKTRPPCLSHRNSSYPRFSPAFALAALLPTLNLDHLDLLQLFRDSEIRKPLRRGIVDVYLILQLPPSSEESRLRLIHLALLPSLRSRTGPVQGGKVESLTLDSHRLVAKGGGVGRDKSRRT